MDTIKLPKERMPVTKQIHGLPHFDDGTDSDSPNWSGLANTVAGTVGANVLGGVNAKTQNALAGGQYGNMNQDIATAMGMLTNAVDPNLADLIPTLTKQVQQGTMTAAQAQAAIQQKSNMLGIKVDPALMQAQTAALTSLQKIATSGGLTPTDRAQLQDINNQVNSQNAGRQGAIQQQMQSQGIAGSGSDIAARLAAGQTANETAGQNAVQVGANAQQRALQALQASGQLGGQIQGEQFGEQAQQAQAQDAIDQFNAQNQTATSNANANRAQQANQANFDMANTIAAKNTDIANQQAMLPLTTAEEQNKENTAAGSAAGQLASGAAASQVKAGSQIAGGSSTTTNGMVNGAVNAAGGWGGIASDVADAFSEGTPDDTDDMFEKLSGIKYKPGKAKVEVKEVKVSPEAQKSIVDSLANIHKHLCAV